MPNYDASTNNNSKRASRIYKDLDLNFGRNVVTNDVNKLTDVEAVKRSVRNLINTNHYERAFHPEIGSDVRSMLFEPMTPIIAAIIARKIEDVIQNFEPRCRLVSVRALPDLDRNIYNVSIEFYVINAPTELVDLSVMLERIR